MTNKKLNYPAIAKEMAILTGAVAIIAAAVYFFLVPSHTSVSSISGLGIVLSNFVPLPLSAITMVLNIVLLIIGFFTCGREFGAKTVYTSVMLPVFLGLFERLFPDFGSMTDSLRRAGYRGKDHEQVPAHGAGQGNVPFGHVRGTLCRPCLR